MSEPTFYGNPAAIEWLHRTQNAYDDRQGALSSEYSMPWAGDVPPSAGSGIADEDIMKIMLAMFSGDRGRLDNYLNALNMSNRDAMRSSPVGIGMLEALGMPTGSYGQ